MWWWHGAALHMKGHEAIQERWLLHKLSLVGCCEECGHGPQTSVWISSGHQERSTRRLRLSKAGRVVKLQHVEITHLETLSQFQGNTDLILFGSMISHFSSLQGMLQDVGCRMQKAQDPLFDFELSMSMEASVMISSHNTLSPFQPQLALVTCTA